MGVLSGCNSPRWLLSKSMKVETFNSDAEYQHWLIAHPQGFVINTTRTLSPEYMVLHRAGCPHISDAKHEKSPGGFTERAYAKVAAANAEPLRDWVATHGRPDKTFSGECGRCKPTDGAAEITLTTDVEWKLWARGEVVHQVEGIKPLLASWEKSSDPAQVRLRAYLDDVTPQLLPLPEAGQLFLHMDIDVEDSRRLLRHYDLENFLTPLFGSRWLPANRFSLVTARKYVGGGSRILCGLAKPKPASDDADWSCSTVEVGRGAGMGEWKEKLRASLAVSCQASLTPGPAQVRIAWRCSAKRNWSTLWKPTGDAMGPALGAANPDKPYQLDDDRIVDLELHRNIDDALGHDVVVGYWWRSVVAPSAPG